MKHEIKQLNTEYEVQHPDQPRSVWYTKTKDGEDALIRWCTNWMVAVDKGVDGARFDVYVIGHAHQISLDSTFIYCQKKGLKEMFETAEEPIRKIEVSLTKDGAKFLSESGKSVFEITPEQREHALWLVEVLAQIKSESPIALLREVEKELLNDVLGKLNRAGNYFEAQDVDDNTTGLHEETAGDIERTVKDVVSKIDERFTKYKSDGV